MSKYCKECGKEIPESSKIDVCEHHQYKKSKIIRQIGGGALGLILSILVAVFTKGRLKL